VVRADGRALYLDDSCNGRLYRLPILSPGRLGYPEIIATVSDSAKGSLDGIALDAAGRLYVAHNGVGRIEVFDPAGRPLVRYQAGNLLASNVAFGGSDLGDLYVTGSPGKKSGPGAVYRLRLGVRGRGSMGVPAPSPAH
jgi:gluconolactonase